MASNTNKRESKIKPLPQLNNKPLIYETVTAKIVYKKILDKNLTVPTCADQPRQAPIRYKLLIYVYNKLKLKI